MHTDDPKPQPEPPTDDAHELPPLSHSSFDIRDLGTLPDDEADAEWLRHPEAWHLH